MPSAFRLLSEVTLFLSPLFLQSYFFCPYLFPVAMWLNADNLSCLTGLARLQSWVFGHWFFPLALPWQRLFEGLSPLKL